VTRDDLETIRRSDINFSIVTDDYPIDTVGFHNNDWVKVRQDVNIITTKPEEETWLRLCFGNRLLHFSTQYNINDT